MEVFLVCPTGLTYTMDIHSQCINIFFPLFCNISFIFLYLSLQSSWTWHLGNQSHDIWQSGTSSRNYRTWLKLNLNSEMRNVSFQMRWKYWPVTESEVSSDKQRIWEVGSGLMKVATRFHVETSNNSSPLTFSESLLSLVLGKFTHMHTYKYRSTQKK